MIQKIESSRSNRQDTTPNNQGALIQTWNYHPWTQQGGRLSHLLGGNASQPGGLMNFSYAYDAVGNVLSIADGRNGGTQTFTYDALDRLTTALASGGIGNYPQESYTYNPTTGNLASKAGVNYTYANAAHKHAVTGLSNGSAYGYDNNGNMTTRHVKEQGVWKDYTLGYDAENRMVQVSGAAAASFGYDGDGQRILATEGVTTTVHIGSHFEYNLQKNEAKVLGFSTRYYFAGSTRIAMRKGTAAAVFMLGDHLGSTGILADGNGSIIGPGGLQLYKPWGESRGTSSISLTKYLYTGQQRLSFGLDFYNARWYDSALGRFAQADTIVPEASQGTQALDRYAYVNNSPVNYVDPTGHDLEQIHYDKHGKLDDVSDKWDPTFKDQVGNRTQAEQAYLHYLRNPEYFAALYANPEAWANSLEAANLDVFFQYSDLHTTAEAAILEGFDPDVAANLKLAHVHYGFGDLKLTTEYLKAAILVGTPAGTLVPVPDTYIGSVTYNGKGIVYRPQGSATDALSIRIMDPGANPRYPLGYVRYYNASGQPVNPLTGGTGTELQTHIPVNYSGPLNRYPR